MSEETKKNEFEIEEMKSDELEEVAGGFMSCDACDTCSGCSHSGCMGCGGG